MRSQLHLPGIMARLVIGLAVAGTFFLFGASLRADQAPLQLRESFAELEQWLSASDYGAAWNEYLKTDQLRTQLAKGSSADREAVQKILSRYESNVDGIGKRRFVAVGSALKLWLAELSVLTPEQLPGAAGEAHKEFVPPTTAEVTALGENVRSRARGLSQFLSQNPAWSKAWKKYLLWSDLQEQLGAKTPDTAQLAKVAQRLSANYTGLENSHFVQLRHSLRRWIDGSLALGKTAVVQKRIHGYSKDLKKGLASYGPDSSHWDAMDIGKKIHFLERFHVAPNVTGAVRARYSKPNLAAYVSAGLIAAAMDREIDEPTSIREMILGASVVGEGHTKGKLAVSLVPSEEQAVLGLKMTGMTKSETIARKRSVQVFANSTTELEANKHVHFSSEGFSSLPASAIATTETDVTGLSHERGSRLIERIAWKKVGKSRGQAQQESSMRASRRVEQRMDAQAKEMLADANDKYRAKFRGPLLRKDAFPGLFQVHSSDASVRLKIQKAAPDQLAAPAAVAEPPSDHDLAVRLHESFVNNMAASLIGGKKVSSDDAEKEGGDGNFLEKLKKQRVKKIEQRRKAEGQPEKAATPAEGEQAPWQMRFASRNPLSVEFRKGTVKFTLRGVEFSGLDDQEYKRAMSMWAVYNVEIDKYGGVRLTLVEQGVDPTAVEKGQRFVAADAPVRSKLRARWKATLEGENGENKVVEVFPLEFPDPQLKNIGQLAFTALSVEDGWLTIALDRVLTKEAKQSASR